MKSADGVTAIAMIVIVSFAIDRIVTATLFVLSLVAPSFDPDTVDGPARRKHAERIQRLLYVVLAGLLGIFVVARYGNVRILSALGIETDPLLDIILTGIILVGGSDRIAAVLKAPGAPGVEKPSPQPIQITGTLTLEEGAVRKSEGQRG